MEPKKSSTPKLKLLKPFKEMDELCDKVDNLRDELLSMDQSESGFQEKLNELKKYQTILMHEMKRISYNIKRIIKHKKNPK